MKKTIDLVKEKVESVGFENVTTSKRLNDLGYKTSAQFLKHLDNLEYDKHLYFQAILRRDSEAQFPVGIIWCIVINDSVSIEVLPRGEFKRQTGFDEDTMKELGLKFKPTLRNRRNYE